MTDIVVINEKGKVVLMKYTKDEKDKKFKVIEIDLGRCSRSFEFKISEIDKFKRLLKKFMPLVMKE